MQIQLHLRGLSAAPVGALVAALCLVNGCGTSRDTGEEQSAAQTQEGGEPAGKARPLKSKKAAQAGRHRSAEGPRIGEIPRDAWPEVWLKDPLAVAGESAATSPRAASARSAASSDEAALPPAPSASDAIKPAPTGAASAGGAWPAVISEEVLGSEVKTIRGLLADRMQSVGRYSGNYKEIQVDSAELAAIAQIVAADAYSPSWKPLARYIRDAAAEMAREARSNGDKFYKPTKAAYDRLDALLSGSKPPDVAESAARLPFSELASRYPLMKRMERAHGWMKSNVNSESLLKSEGDRVVREASVLAMLARVVGTPGYVDSDDDSYRQFAEEVSQGALAAAAAARDADFAAYIKGLDRVYKACNDCHKNFKNSE